MSKKKNLPFYFIGNLEINKSEKNANESVMSTFDSLKNFIEAIIIRLDFRTDIYLLKKEENNYIPLRILNRDDLSVLSDFFINSKAREIILFSLKDFFDKYQLDDFITKSQDNILVAFGLSNCEHWDYNFVKMSELYSDAFTIIGFSEEHNSIVSQKYKRGKISTGIYKTNSSKYIGEKAYEKLNLNEQFFNSDFYST